MARLFPNNPCIYYIKASIYTLALKFVHLSLICRCEAQALYGPNFTLKVFVKLMIMCENLAKETNYSFINILMHE